MNRILIAGKDSYLGTSFEKWLLKISGEYEVKTIDMKGDSWRAQDFSGYDVVFHVAGIAHVSRDPDMEDLYYAVNRDLAVETAQKAKYEGVEQFILMSSIVVYGDSSLDKRIIDINTVPQPGNHYGKSKLQAEEGVRKLESDEFKTVILRSPMVYGKGSKGNYPRLARLARILPVFPDMDNERSMLHIDNLCEFIRMLIEERESGLFFHRIENMLEPVKWFG